MSAILSRRMPMPIITWHDGMFTPDIHSVTGCSTCTKAKPDQVYMNVLKPWTQVAEWTLLKRTGVTRRESHGQPSVT